MENAEEKLQEIKNSRKQTSVKKQPKVAPKQKKITKMDTMNLLGSRYFKSKQEGNSIIKTRR